MQTHIARSSRTTKESPWLIGPISCSKGFKWQHLALMSTTLSLRESSNKPTIRSPTTTKSASVEYMTSNWRMDRSNVTLHGTNLSTQTRLDSTIIYSMLWIQKLVNNRNIQHRSKKKSQDPLRLRPLVLWDRTLKEAAKRQDQISVQIELNWFRAQRRSLGTPWRDSITNSMVNELRTSMTTRRLIAFKRRTRSSRLLSKEPSHLSSCITCLDILRHSTFYSAKSSTGCASTSIQTKNKQTTSTTSSSQESSSPSSTTMTLARPHCSSSQFPWSLWVWVLIQASSEKSWARSVQLSLVKKPKLLIHLRSTSLLLRSSSKSSGRTRLVRTLPRCFVTGSLKGARNRQLTRNAISRNASNSFQYSKGKARRTPCIK